MLQLQGFNTFVADIRLRRVCFFFELLGSCICTQGYEPRKDFRGEDAGDDAWSWAVDGARLRKWHDGRCEDSYGSEGVIGFAVDMHTSGGAVMRVSVNGSFGAPNGCVQRHECALSVACILW